jgi:hypothetical protein
MGAGQAMTLKLRNQARAATVSAVLTTLAACGGSDGNLGPADGPPAYTSVPLLKVSQPNTLAPNCDGVTAEGTLFPGTAIEPQIAVGPVGSSNVIAVWQQNRWSTGGSQAIGVASSLDGGNSWSLSNAPFFSRCAGGNSSNAGNYARASNPWVSFAPSGVAYALALAFTGDVLASGSSSAMLVAQSLDGGANWTLPVALIQDGPDFFNDKGSITADPTNSNFVYAVWDRLTTQNTGPSYFTLTANAGSTWAVPRAIYDPGTNSQTINNIIVVTPNDTLVDLFNEIDTAADGTASSHLKAITSTDNGSTWSAQPVSIADMLGVGTTDPNGGAVRDSVLLFTVALGPTGIIYVAWQDARFSSGDHDGIALSFSSDNGATWSTPVEVNGDTAVQAFTPTLNVSVAGVIGVSYYDLRNAHYLKTELLADAWITTSVSASTFTETHLSGPFDLQVAPDTTEGYFLGDYQALINNGQVFQPLYAQPNQGTTVSTDVVFATANAPATTQAAASALAYRAVASGTPKLSEAVRLRISQRIRADLARRRGGP